MVINNTFSKSVKRIYKENIKIQELMDIITFAESSAGLNIKLYPVQKFILKLFYKLPLNDSLNKENSIKIKDEFNENVIYEFFSEKDFFNFLKEEKRINLDLDTYDKPDTLFTEVVLICGRRASKTTITSIITCYSLYILLSIENPHSYFGVMRTDPIGITFVSNSKNGAYRTFKAVTDLITNSKFFARYAYEDGAVSGELWLKSESFKQEEEDGIVHTNKGNILVSSQTAGPNVRGASNIIICIDEIAHFRDADTVRVKDKYLDEIVYEALYPSILGFVDPETGKGVGKSFVISSPKGKDNLLYRMYEDSFKQDNVIMINVPSNWINERISPTDLRKLKQRSEGSFRQEIRAEFTDRESNWITEPGRLQSIFDYNNKNTPYQRINTTYYSGFDLGLTSDWSVIAIGHYEERVPETYLPEREEFRSMMSKDKGCVVIDYIKYWIPPKNGMIDIDLLLNEIEYIYTRFNIRTGSYDQYCSGIFTQCLQKKPKIRLEYEPATVASNSDRAQLMKSLISEGRLLLPYISEVKEQFERLYEVTLKDQMVKVENARGHDDIYSAVSRAVEKIMQYSHFTNKSNTMFVNKQVNNSFISLNKNRSISNNSTRNSNLCGKVKI